MRPKRHKPDRRRTREFGRQVDADLTESADPETPDKDSVAFSGAEFPDLESPGSGFGGGCNDAEDAPEITHSMVRERAMRLLVHREHGRLELQQKLQQRELPSELIVSVLDQLAEEGLQCDVRFAESYTRMRVGRGFGANKIRADLQNRRVEQSVIEAAIRDHGADWDVLATEALDKKFGARCTLDPKSRAKMQRFLHQRGFTTAQIRSAMKHFETDVSAD